MQYVLVAIFTLWISVSFAKGPFGEVNGNNFSIGRDQSSCTAQKLLENVIHDVGIDIIDGNANQIWQCKNGEGSMTAEKRRCPYDQYMKEKEYTCFSNTSSGYPYVCVAGARSEIVVEDYAGNDKPIKIPRARYRQLFVFQSNITTKNFEMDADGCQAVRVQGYDQIGFSSNGTIDFRRDECVKMLKDSLSGGYIYSPRPKEYNRDAIPGIKFCDSSRAKDGSYISAHLTGVKRLYHCYEAFPNLDTLLINSNKVHVPASDSFSSMK